MGIQRTKIKNFMMVNLKLGFNNSKCVGPKRFHVYLMLSLGYASNDCCPLINHDVFYTKNTLRSKEATSIWFSAVRGYLDALESNVYVLQCLYTYTQAHTYLSSICIELYCHYVYLKMICTLMA